MESIQSDEKKRIKITETELIEYYSSLKREIEDNQIPPCLIINLDEMGYTDDNPRVDTKVIVPKNSSLKNIRVAESSRSKTTTLIQCISLDGSKSCQACVVDKLWYESPLDKYFPNTALYSSSTGFINKYIMAHWIQTVFIPHVSNVRKNNNLDPSTKAILLLDGASSHFPKGAKELLERNNIIMFQILPNSSHLVQP